MQKAQRTLSLSFRWAFFYHFCRCSNKLLLLDFVMNHTEDFQSLSRANFEQIVDVLHTCEGGYKHHIQQRNDLKIM